MPTVATDELSRWLDEGADLALIDVRTAASFSREHIPGAVNIPAHADDFVDLVAVQLGGDHRRRIVVYGDADSASAAQRLTDAGFRAVFDLEPGFAGWAATGGAVIAPSEAE